MGDSVIYEVTCSVEDGIADDFAAWLSHHVPEVGALPGFTAHGWGEEIGAGAPGRRVFVAAYRLADAAAMQRYLDEDAPRMRADGVERFGDRYVASRRVITVRG